MPTASVIRQLKDGDLAMVHNLMRRDALEDLQIVEKIEALLGKSLGKTDGARRMVISRYRSSRPYKTWLRQYTRKEFETAKELSAVTQRCELVAKAIEGRGGEGIEAMSTFTQARLLTLATEASDDDLVAAAEKGGWISNALRLSRDAVLDKYRAKTEELQATIEAMINAPKVGGDTKAALQKVNKDVAKLMGVGA